MKSGIGSIDLRVSNNMEEFDALTTEYDRALEAEDFDRIGEIVSILNNSSGEIRGLALPLYVQIKGDLFQHDRNLPNYDLERYRHKIPGKPASEERTKDNTAVAKDTAPGHPSITEPKSVEQVFVEFYKQKCPTILSVKGLFLVRI